MVNWARRFSCQHVSFDFGAELLFLAVADNTRMRAGATPAFTSAVFAALARFSPRARLYSAEPRSSA